MALFKQTVYPNKVNEINKAGKHLKVINSQTELDIRVFNLVGELVLSTKVRAGFEITLPVFAKVVVSAEQEQKIEMWVDENPLGYNAPTANANSLNSYKANHYGDTDEILPFEPTRLSAKITSDQPWWYGGSNVDSDNGIPVAAGEVAEIRGAAQISAAIGAKGEYLPVNEEVILSGGVYIKDCVINEHGVFGINSSREVFSFKNGVLESITPIESGYIPKICKVGESKVAYFTYFGNYICELDVVTNKTKLIKVPNDSTSTGAYLTKMVDVIYIDDKYVVYGDFYDGLERESFQGLAVLEVDGWKFKNRAAMSIDGMWPVNDTHILLQNYSTLKLVEFSLIDETDIIGAAPEYTGAWSGSLSNATLTEYGDYYLLKTQGVNSTAMMIDKQTLTPKNFGYCDAAVYSEAGLILVKGGEFHITEDLGLTYTVQPAPRDFNSSSVVVLAYLDKKLYILSSEFIGFYTTEKQRVNIKQTFRVLKAYS